jgi:hypothetical protein
MFYLKPEPLGQTWVEIDGMSCGARPDERGPTGGGRGYANLLPRPPVRVSTLDTLMDALKNARRGDVVFVDGRAGPAGPGSPTTPTA